MSSPHFAKLFVLVAQLRYKQCVNRENAE